MKNSQTHHIVIKKVIDIVTACFSPSFWIPPSCGESRYADLPRRDDRRVWQNLFKLLSKATFNFD